MTLKSPSAPFLSQLALPNASVISQKAMKAEGEEAFAEKPVGSGAFSVKEWLRGEKIVLVKNPNFWQAKNVSLDEVDWLTIPDDNTRMLKVQAGELDALAAPEEKALAQGIGRQTHPPTQQAQGQ